MCVINTFLVESFDIENIEELRLDVMLEWREDFEDAVLEIGIACAAQSREIHERDLRL